MITSNLPWWQQTVIYQIYPKSFQAESGQTQGSLAGIIRRLDYLKTLGIGAIWLTPIYLSPQVDNGYDISDYYQIDPAYGTMDEFEQLVQQAHQRNIRIIMDMVFNHTSTEHAWFKAATNQSSPYRQYYFWRDGQSTDSPPNNWRSKFGGSAWQWHAESQQYYLHLFAVEQADLNWGYAPVRQELKQICEFWADKGVDAFRLDVINLVSKQQDFPDDSKGDGRRFYTDGPRIHDYLQEFSRDVFTPRQLMTVGEMSSTTLAHCQRYASLNGKELSMTFNFHHLKVDYPNGEKWVLGKPDFVELKRLFNYWQQGMHNRAWNALFWCNHDQPRIVSRFGDDERFRCESAKMLAMALHGMQGTPYIYQGEEIGMTNPKFQQITDYRDIESLNMFQFYQQQGTPEQQILAILAEKSRDNSRTPMQWDDSVYAGFSDVPPWINVTANYKQINVKQALLDQNSIFYCYQQLIALRKQLPVLIFGDYQDLMADHPGLWCYLRQWENDKLLVIANLTAEVQSYHLPYELQQLNWQVTLSNYADKHSSPSQQLRPYEACYLTITVPSPTY